nr:MAG TPA: hypothetical protein [Caudoviricetes sp.]
MMMLPLKGGGFRPLCDAHYYWSNQSESLSTI